jgi:predicted transcriptional regulator
MRGLSLRLPKDLESKLDEEARREGVARSEIARTAIAEFPYADPKIRRDALALAEEAVPLDNEGLRIAEGRGRYSTSSPNRRGKQRR